MRHAAPLVAAMLAMVPTPVPKRLQARFDADRVYVEVRARNGATLEMYTDTGGGLLLSAAAATRLGLTVRTPVAPSEKPASGPGARVTDVPAFARDETAPPIPSDRPIAVVSKVAEIPGWPDQGDGILGQAWFAGHVWTWNYPAHRLTLRPDRWRPTGAARRMPIGFKSAGGKRELNFPRIVVQVDGRPLSLLLDTGAETLLTPQALAAIHDGEPAFRATSMIAQSVFEGWETAHPDWRVIEDAQMVTRSRMIEVPSVRIAGITVGPVWFTERTDASFHKFMSAMTDARVEGSLGGNALAGLVMTLDYPRAQAWFTCKAHCTVARAGT